MADDSDFAVTALEALSLVAVPQLTAKAQRILWAFAADAAKQWPSYRWPKAESELRSDLQSQFRNHNRLTFYASSGSRAVPVVGVTRGSIEAMLSIWVESPPKRTDVRQRILTAADEGGLPPRWTRRLDTWQGLVIEQRLVSFATHDDAAAWLHRGFEELDRSGLLALMPTLGKATAEETGERVG